MVSSPAPANVRSSWGFTTPSFKLSDGPRPAITGVRGALAASAEPSRGPCSQSFHSEATSMHTAERVQARSLLARQ